MLESTRHSSSCFRYQYQIYTSSKKMHTIVHDSIYSLYEILCLGNVIFARDIYQYIGSKFFGGVDVRANLHQTMRESASASAVYWDMICAPDCRQYPMQYPIHLDGGTWRLAFTKTLAENRGALQRTDSLSLSLCLRLN